MNPASNKGPRTGLRESLTLDLGKQTLSDIQFVLTEIAVQETRGQIKADNPPSRVVIDNREGKPLEFAERKIEIDYGEFLDKLMIQQIERSVLASVRSSGLTSAGTATGEPGKGFAFIASKSDWRWLYIETPGTTAKPITNPAQTLGAMAVGSTLIYMPKSEYAGLLNMVSARIAAGWSKKRLYYSQKKQKVPTYGAKEGGKYRTGKKGFMARSIDKLKRNRLLKNYSIRVGFTGKFKLTNERYSHGTPFISVRAKRLSSSKGVGRRYRKFT